MYNIGNVCSYYLEKIERQGPPIPPPLKGNYAKACGTVTAAENKHARNYNHQ